MDFHQLPRRDLQALCKRNGIRANMTNAAMADALAALPAVDGIEEEEKMAAAAEEEEEEGDGEMQGISLPGGRGVALTPHEVIMLDGSEEEDKDLMPALGVGRRRASRRARVGPVAAPTTRERAAAAEAVPARTTRARSQRMVVSPSAPEEEAPKERRSSRRAVATKTSTEQEEEEKGTQGDGSDDCVVDLSVQERQADVQQCEDSPNFRNDAVSSEIHHASEDTEMVPVISGEASGAAEENEVPTSGGMLQSAAKAIEEEEPVTAPTTRKRAAASMAKTAAEAVPARTTRARSQMTVVSAPEEEAPKARRTSRRAVARKTSTGQEHEEKGTQGGVSDECLVDSSVEERKANVQQCEDSPNFRNDAVSSEEIHHASEGTETVPVISGEAAEEVDFTSGAAGENEVPTSGGMLQSAAKAIEEKEPVTAPTTRKRAAASMAKTAAEAVPARTTRARSQMTVVLAPEEEAPKARRTSRRAVARKTSTGQEHEEKGTQGGVSDENEVPTSVEMLQSAAKAIEEKEDMAVVEEEAVVATEMPQRTTTVAEGVIEVVTVDNLSQATVTDDEGVVKESGFTAGLIDVSIEEEAAVAADEMTLSLATMDESVKEELVPIDILSQATVTDDEGAVKESGFSCDLTDLSFEEKVAADGMSQSLAKLDERVEQVVTVDNLSQATLTDDEGAVKESGFSCDLADVSVEEDGVVAADEMSQRSVTLDKSVKEEMATVENLSQATVTDDEWVVKESAFASDLPPVVDPAREDFSDLTATKSMSIDSITVEPMVSQADDVPLRMYSNSGGQKNVTEHVAVEQVKEGKECEALGSLSLRKLRIKLKEKLAVAQENEADDVPPCSSGGEKNASEPVAVEREEEMKEGNESESLGSLSLRKLRIKLKEKVTAAQENEVKGGKGSKALDKLSLRRLKMKLKETLNAQKVIGESHPSMY